MPDITMCKFKCKKSDTCYRYKAKPNTWQAYFTENPKEDNKKCEYYIDIKKFKI